MAKRSLTAFEIDEARLVFSGSLNLGHIHVHEKARWPDWIAALGARFHNDPPPSHNAVTLGNHIYFPVTILTSPSNDAGQSLSQMAWLIHELTHCWQYQQRGIAYFFDALRAQVRLGSQAYAYGWRAGLERALAEGKRFHDFNPEQQGEITRHYYYRLKQGFEVDAWLPWILTLQASGPNS
jgi:hypothetical protein